MIDCVIVERIELGEPMPDYCVHGRTTCVGCTAWCWLGDKTHDAVKSGRMQPLCVQCADRYLPPNTKPAGNLHDHPRVDGPH